MKSLKSILENIKNKIIIKEFESNPKNYDGFALLGKPEYYNALVDVIIYDNS